MSQEMEDPAIIHSRYALVGDSLELMENVELVIGKNLEILDISETTKVEKETTVLLPSFFNAHAHAGDYGLRGIKPNDLSILVGPEGLKVKYLTSLSDQRLRLNLENFNYESSILGIGGYNDFREGGVQGLTPYLESPLLKKKVKKAGYRTKITGFEGIEAKNSIEETLDYFLPFVQILGRPKDLEELDLVLDIGGLGIRDLYAYNMEDLFHMAKTVEKRDSHFQIHAGEDPKLTERSNIENGMGDIQFCAENLKPNAIVHGNHGTIEDYRALKEGNIGLILCPRSNIFTKTKLHPYDLIQKAGLSPLQIGIGSDNAMFHSPVMWKDIKAIFDNSSFSAREILQMATVGGANISGFKNWSLEKGNYFNGTKWLFHRSIDKDEIYTRMVFHGRNAAIMHLD